MIAAVKENLTTIATECLVQNVLVNPGEYGLTFRTNFNGFYSNKIVEVNDKPIMSLYDDSIKVSYLVA